MRYLIPEIIACMQVCFQLFPKYFNLAPGSQQTIVVSFTPQLKEAIDTKTIITYHCPQTGTCKINVPVRCSPRIVRLECTSRDIYFGDVVIGERKVEYLNIRVKGSIKTSLCFANRQGIDLSDTKRLHSQDIDMLSQLEFEKQFVVSGHEHKLRIEYVPYQVGILDASLILRIKHTATTIHIKLRGQCIEPPIYMEKKLYDMQICLVGHQYKQKVVVANRSGQSIKCQLLQPAETKKYFQFKPLLSFISPRSHSQILIRFEAGKDIPSVLENYSVKSDNQGSRHYSILPSEDDDCYEIPFKLVAAGQSLPVNFSVRFKLSTDKLIVSPLVINFGKIYEGTGARVTIQLTNESLLEQQVELAPTSQNTIVNMAQPLSLLPRETIQCPLFYKNIRQNNDTTIGSERREESFINCRVITGNISARELKLPVHCTIIKPFLQLSVTKVNFPALQPGQRSCTGIRMSNIETWPILYEVFLPPYEICGFTATPLVSALQPGQQVEFLIRYESPKILSSVDRVRKIQSQLNGQKAGRRSKMDKLYRKHSFTREVIRNDKYFQATTQLEHIGGTIKEFEGGLYCEWLIPIYFKRKDFPDASAEVTYIEVTTTAVKQTLILKTKTIDFGQVAVGTQITKQIQVTNNGLDSDLKLSKLPVFSGFAVLNNLRGLANRETGYIIVEFAPTEQQQFYQVITISTDTSLVSCVLRGQGIRPQLRLSPETGLLNMGHILKGHTQKNSFTIFNNSQFDLNFQLSLQEEGCRNLNGQSAFRYLPMSGTIESQGFCLVEVEFCPDRSNQHYYQLLLIDVAEQKNPRRIYIWGSGNNQNFFAKPHQIVRLPSNSQPLKYYEKVFEREASPLQAPNSHSQIVLNFHEEDVDISRSFLQQNTESSITNSEESAQNNTIDNASNPFSMKGGENSPGPFQQISSLGIHRSDSQYSIVSRKTQISKLDLCSTRTKLGGSSRETRFKIVMPDSEERFECDCLQGSLEAGEIKTVTFIFNPPEEDPFISSLDILRGIGQWHSVKAQLKMWQEDQVIQYGLILRVFIKVL